MVTLPLQQGLAAGTYHLFVVADGTNQVVEANESNNTASTTINLSYAPLPDLSPSNVVAPVEGWSGRAITVSWTVANQGSAVTQGTWTDNVYLSPDGTTNSEVLLGHLDSPENLAPGQSYQRSQDFTLPDGISGNYWIIVTANANNSIFESNANNNTSISQPFPVHLTPYADLQVASVTAPPTATAGQQATFSWTVTNAGTGATDASAWTDSVYLSTDQTFSSDDLLIGSAQNPSYLAPGESYSQSLTATLPGNLHGPYYVLVVTNSTHSQYEYNYGNNDTGSSTTPVQIQAAQQGYLHVSQRVRFSPAAEHHLRRSAHYRELDGREHRGQHDPSQQPLRILGRWPVRLTDPQLGRGPRHLAGRPPGAANNPAYWSGRATAIRKQSRCPRTSPGPGTSSQCLIRIILPAGRASEPAPFPETRAPQFQIQLPPAPDLQVTSVAAPTSGQAGQPIDVTWTVSNEGFGPTAASSWTDAVYLSADATLETSGSGADTLLGTFAHTGSLPPLENYTQTESVKLPDGISGPYYVFVLTDSGNNVFEHADSYDAKANNSKDDPTPVQVTLPSASGLAGDFHHDLLRCIGAADDRELDGRQPGTGEHIGRLLVRPARPFR